MPGTRLSFSDLSELSAEERLRWLRDHPISGGEHNPDDDEDDEDEEDEEDEDGEDDEDGDPSGNKGDTSKPDSKKTGKLYTKSELDAIVETAVKDRLARADRQRNRDSAKDKGQFEKLAGELQKEIDEDWKPKADKAEQLESRVEALEGVVNAQVEAILKSLPKNLRDLDLGEDEDPVKRLNWLIEKVQPKAGRRRKSEETEDEEEEDGEEKKKSGNPASPAPRNKQGADKKKTIPAPVKRNRF